VKVVNTILWDEKREFEGDGFDVEYSCVRNGFAGEGNIDDDPLFVDVDKPKGEDGIWGSYDDGLILQQKSPCIDAGKDDINVDLDITNIERPLNNGFDMGAYEIPVLLNGETMLDFGILNFNNEFIIGAGIGDFALDVSSKRDLYKRLHGRSALTIRIYARKDKHVNGINSAEVQVLFQKDGKNISNTEKIRFYRNGQNNSYYIFTSRKFDTKNSRFEGKPVFLIADTSKQKINMLKDTNYYILPVLIDEKMMFKSVVDINQF
jgi:hypothetical protein